MSFAEALRSRIVTPNAGGAGRSEALPSIPCTHPVNEVTPGGVARRAE